MALCLACQNFTVQAFARDEHEYRGFRINAVIRTAKAGCPFCSMLIENLKSVDNESDEFSYLKLAFRDEMDNPKPIKWFSTDQVQLIKRNLRRLLVPVWLHICAKRDGSLNGRNEGGLNLVGFQAFVSPFSHSSTLVSGSTRPIQLHAAADPGTHAHTSKDITGRLATEAYTWSSSNFDAIKSWHKKCCKNHPECSMSLSRSQTITVKDAPLPTRCLEIIPKSVQTNTNLPSFSSILRHTAGQRGKYIALSHRWNSDTSKSSTLKSNLNARMNTVDSPPALTRLFEHAGALAFMLGVKYIWIDSICIIQDDKNDWKQEAVKMADYYQYAWLTISATVLTTDGGLFGTMPNQVTARITRLPYRNRDGVRQGDFYVQCVGESQISLDYDKYVSQSKLLRRGWVHQEWMLSRRILTFSQAGLFVQCQQDAPRSLSDDPVRNTQGPTGARKPNQAIAFSFKMALDLKMSTKWDILSSWTRVVETYSGLELTKLEEDRLIALAGVAKEFGAALQGQNARSQNASGDQEGQQDNNSNNNNKSVHLYVSGSWFGFLNGLLWEQLTPGPRVRVRGIPTWSWASMASEMVNDEGKTVLTGMAVKWAVKREKPVPYSKAPEAVADVKQALTVDVDDKSLQPMFDKTHDEPPTNEYDISHRFVMLQLRGRLFPIRVHGKFENQVDAKIVATLTDHEPDFGRDMWRRVTLPEDPGTVIGWASIEHPAHQSDEAVERCDELRAFVLFTRKESRGGLGYGNWLGYQWSFEIIIVKEVSTPNYSNVYERVGIGRLFGNEVESCFKSIEDELLWLV